MHATHQHVKDLESLMIGKGCNLLWMNSNEGISPMNYIHLMEETAIRRDAEEEEKLRATLTVRKDFRKRENVPKLRLVPEVLLKLIKNQNFFLSMFFILVCAFLILILEAEREINRSYAQGVIFY